MMLVLFYGDEGGLEFWQWNFVFDNTEGTLEVTQSQIAAIFNFICGNKMKEQILTIPIWIIELNLT